MKLLYFLFVVVLLIEVSLSKDVEESDINEAKNRHTFIERITKECIEEIGLNPANAQKILLGDMSDKSEKAKVKLTNFIQQI